MRGKRYKSYNCILFYFICFWFLCFPWANAGLRNSFIFIAYTDVTVLMWKSVRSLVVPCWQWPQEFTSWSVSFTFCHNKVWCHETRRVQWNELNILWRTIKIILLNMILLFCQLVQLITISAAQYNRLTDSLGFEWSLFFGCAILKKRNLQVLNKIILLFPDKPVFKPIEL